MDGALGAELKGLQPAGTRAQRVGEKIAVSLTAFWKPFRIQCSVKAVVEELFNKNAFYVFFTGSALSHVPEARLERSVNPEISPVDDVKTLGYKHYAVSKFLHPEQSMCVYILSKRKQNDHPAFHSGTFFKYGVDGRKEETSVGPPTDENKATAGHSMLTHVPPARDTKADLEAHRLLEGGLKGKTPFSVPAHPPSPAQWKERGRQPFRLEIDYDDFSGSDSTSSLSRSRKNSLKSDAVVSDEASEIWYDGIDGTREIEEWEPVDAPLHEDESRLRTKLAEIFMQNDNQRAHTVMRAAARRSTVECAEPRTRAMDSSRDEEPSCKDATIHSKEDDVFDNPGRFAGRVFTQNDMELFWYAFSLQHLLIEVDAAEKEADHGIITRERFMRVLHTCLSSYRTPMKPRERKQYLRKQTKRFEAMWREVEPRGPKDFVNANTFLKWLSTDAHGVKKNSAWRNLQDKPPESFLAELHPTACRPLFGSKVTP